MKKAKILICVLVLIIIGLVVLVVLFATGKLNCKKCCEDKATTEVKLDISKLVVIFTLKSSPVYHPKNSPSPFFCGVKETIFFFGQ